MALTIDIDMRDFVKWRAGTSAAVDAATRKAGSSARRAMRTETNRAIRATKAIKLQAISQAVYVLGPRGKQLVWAVGARGAQLAPVIGFTGVRQTKTGIRVEINKGKTSVIPHAFLATMPTGHRGVFLRTGEWTISSRGRYAGKRREKIREAFTTRVAEAMKDNSSRILGRGRDEFLTTFARVLPLEVNRSRR